jgi:hypothetical protein
VFIVMPLTHADAYPEQADGMIEPYKSELVDVAWDVKHGGHGRWELSGTREKPTLSPSLNWIDKWHGFLRNGRMESC